MKKSVIALMMFALLGVSASAIAAKDPAAKFAAHKQKVLDRVEKNHACMTAATDAMQLKSCFPKQKFDPNKIDFVVHKEKLLNRNALHRDCVNAAQTKEDVKACVGKKEKEDKADNAVN